MVILLIRERAWGNSPEEGVSHILENQKFYKRIEVSFSDSLQSSESPATTLPSPSQLYFSSWKTFLFLLGSPPATPTPILRSALDRSYVLDNGLLFVCVCGFLLRSGRGRKCLGSVFIIVLQEIFGAVNRNHRICLNFRTQSG